jgi:hypothetical protein
MLKFTGNLSKYHLIVDISSKITLQITLFLVEKMFVGRIGPSRGPRV